MRENCDYVVADSAVSIISRLFAVIHTVPGSTTAVQSSTYDMIPPVVMYHNLHAKFKYNQKSDRPPTADNLPVLTSI